MSFANLAPIWVATGLLALAAGLYLLQRLRVRHRDLVVPSTLFWREAVEEARARVLVRRFRHPLAYLLVLLIGGLLWLGVAGPVTAADDGADHVLLLDGSAGMARGDRFARALGALRGEVAARPRAHTTVLACGARTRTVLLPGEHPELLERRLQGLRPEPCPATVDGVLRQLLLQKGARDLHVAVVGGAPREGALDLLPAGVRVAVLPLPQGDDGRNTGITALGVAEAASGAYDLVDVLLELRGDATGAAVQLRLDGAPVQATALAEERADARLLRFADLPARGQLLQVTLPGGDALDLDDRAELRLPLRRPFRVALAPDVDGPVAAALRCDPAVVLDQQPADLVVRHAGDPFGGDLPALELAPAAQQEHAFLLRHDAVDDSAVVLREALGRLGLQQIDAMELAQAAARPISVGAEPGPVRAVRVWSELCTDRFDFARSRALPLFVARAVRWLGGEVPLLPHATAGEALPAWPGAFQDAAGVRLDPAGVAFTPPQAGVYRSERGEVVAALADPAATAGVLPTGAPPAAAAGAGFDWFTLLGLGALLLLLLEWFLYRSGRMP